MASQWLDCNTQRLHKHKKQSLKWRHLANASKASAGVGNRQSDGHLYRLKMTGKGFTVNE